MTAEIAILNTHGVAIAADSATTLRFGEKEHKIYNSANKVFSLSKYHPVGIMIYNNASYMGIEWEIIIKEYRRILGKKSYKTLFGYADNFINFISKFKFIKQEQEKKFLLSFCGKFYSYFKRNFIYNLRKELGQLEKITDRQINKVFNDTIRWLDGIHNKKTDEKLFKVDLEFINLFKNEITKVIRRVFEGYPLSNIQINKLILLLKNGMQKKIGATSIYTGIVITGFGEDEIFPSIYSCHIHGRLGKCLMISNEQKKQISNNNSACIIPFAQSEMVISFMEGIDPDFRKEIEKQVSSLLMNIEEILDESYKEKLSLVRDSFFKYIENFKIMNYISPVMNIVDSLQKTELAEMAESLVNLTTFKKHVSKGSETVGGPIDVAVITKGDGFIWIKRKQYFDGKLNNHFFNNYFEEEDDE
jgi:hypothetical protein